MSCLVLDAMGVIFAAADDVGELLIPFITGQSGTTDEAVIQSAYLEASLGNISAEEFWLRVGVSPQLEDDYLELHKLNPGIMQTLSAAQHSGLAVWCLSNDIGRWSVKLRHRLGVDRFLQQSIISADVGMRKPDSGIYQALLDVSGYTPGDLLFVDDRQKNVDAARRLGIESFLFETHNGFNEVQDWIDLNRD
jgi:HAD superfamily hydrolase (TIGR01509 family)